MNIIEGGILSANLRNETVSPGDTIRVRYKSNTNTGSCSNYQTTFVSVNDTNSGNVLSAPTQNTSVYTDYVYTVQNSDTSLSFTVEFYNDPATPTPTPVPTNTPTPTPTIY